MTLDTRSLAAEIVRGVGGESNILSATHCATRLRLRLRDEAKADREAVEQLAGVITVMQAAGQFQVVVGNEVAKVHTDLMAATSLSADDTGNGATNGDADRDQSNVFNRLIDLISALLQPILWTLAAAGLLKAFLSAAGQWGWLAADSQTALVLNAAADSIFYFLPMFLAITAAKRFRTNQFTALAIAGALVYPSITALYAAGDSLSFAGIPVVLMNYTGSVVPIIVAVWLQGHLERFLDRVLPGVVRNFTTPLLTLALMVPFVLITIGPITTYAANGVSSGVAAIFGFAPWLAGALMGGFWQVFVLFGLHWGFVPIITNDLAANGFSLLTGPLVSAVLAQAAATLAVLVRTRSQVRRKVAGPGALSGFLAGVTEPAIYGVNLPLKKPFFFGIVGGALGGAIAASGGSAASTFVFPSALALPAFSEVGNFALQLLGTGVAIAVAFTLTFLFVDRESEDAVSAPAPADETIPSPATGAGLATGGGVATTVATRTVDVLAPVSGSAVPLTDVADRAFSSGALGNGLAIVPTDGHVHAPVSGVVMAAMRTGHAFGIKTDEGVEVLVHIGIDTVNLGGRGFRPQVERGQEVRAGDLLAEFDTEVVLEAGYDTTTLVVVTNTKQLGAVTPVASGAVERGVTAVQVQV